MEKGRKTKVIAILALVVAVIGMSLGFAAFSNMLTISSSATVTPNEENFKMKVYGIGVDPSTISMEYGKFPSDLSYYNSDTISKPIASTSISPGATDATIDNGNVTMGQLSIKNISANFGGRDEMAVYFFMIKNEGNYDAYLDTSNFEKLYSGQHKKTCIADEDATQELVEAACDGVTLMVNIGDSSGNVVDINSLSNLYRIAKQDYIFLGVAISYLNGSALADGKFSVAFDPIEFNFSTVS